MEELTVIYLAVQMIRKQKLHIIVLYVTSTAFDYMFMDGEHGHGKWMMHQSLPPYMYVERDIESGFGGRLDKIINSRIEQILRK